MRETNLLQHIYNANHRLRDDVTIPPGDDMGGVYVGGVEVLAAVDQLVAGRHFLTERTPLALVGRKAVTRNLSDVAAMAARPIATLAAVTLPPDFTEARAGELFEALRATAESFACPLIGGDMAVHQHATSPLVITVTVLAQPLDTAHPPVRRGGARPGDRVFVTGVLGGSFGADGMGHHLTFEPRLRVARELYEHLGSHLHAMIDLSDGLGRDVDHLAEHSGVNVLLDARSFPCRPGCDWSAALVDGEDYELCFTLSAEAAAGLPRVIDGVPITEIGAVFPRSEFAPRSNGEPSPQRTLVQTPDGSLLDAAQSGWEHDS